ncbi:Uu.00g046870.m01.CDS01 [Anthostomella pinea]|uniref:Uu.00g046870.m01.CDS01 n=1 Tax=Anthostomella pinea TaxID=933095 RepID=A0AAI8VBB3_9PEZI|nr:Uu.00g046870.m01.CDS01 [Anthostomella pinea]
MNSVLDELLANVPDDMPPFMESVSALHPLKLEHQAALYYGNQQRIGIPSAPGKVWVRANRSRLRVWLATNLDLQWGKIASKVEQGAEKVTVTFRDGSSATGDVLVGADGMHSIVREHVLGRSNEEILRNLPISTITGETTLSEDAFLRQLENAHSVSLSGITFVDDMSPEDRLALARKITEHFDPKLKTLLDNTKPEGVNPAPWLPKDGVIEAIPVSRITLFGDAAHPTSPFRGEGGVHALRDAVYLGKFLGQLRTADTASIHEAFTAYQEEMVPRGASVVRGARAQVDLYYKDLAKVRMLGQQAVGLPKERMEMGTDGIRSIVLE